ERGHRVTGVGGEVRLRDGLVGHGDATGIGVLDDRDRRTLVVPRRTPRGVGVGVVVVAHFLAVELLRLRQAGRGRRVDVQGRGLVRVLAVTQRGGPLVG